MNYNFNPDITQLKQSDIRRMTLECASYSDGINLSQGICDLPLPPILPRMVNRALAEGYNTYTRYDGLEMLRKQIARKMQDFNGVEYRFQDEICVTSGTSAAFFLSLFVLKTDIADEIILFQPFYGYHLNTILTLGMKPVIITLDPARGWAVDFARLKQVISKRTKAIVINTPANPSGKVFSAQEIKELGRIACQHNVLIITDEIYEYITYDGLSHISPAAFSELKQQVITIGGFSKTFAITGWRLAYVCGNSRFIAKLGVLNDLFYICAPAPLQKAVAEGLAALPCEFYDKIKVYYQRNRDLLVETLTQKGVNVYIPQGAYYLLADFTVLGFASAAQAAERLLAKTHLAVVPGPSFYASGEADGERLVRFCFAKEYPILQEACARLKQF